MSLTLPALEETVDELKSLDFDVQCSVADCDLHATFWIVCRSCNRHVPWCSPHLLAHIAFYATHHLVCPATHVVFCRGCDEQVVGRYWRDLFDVIPIEGT